MTGIVIKLKPNEKLLLNGILLQNGDRAARLRVRSDEVSILRASDAITPHEATTPIKRIYYIAQLALAGEASHEDAAQQIITALLDIQPIFEKTNSEDIEKAFEGARTGKFFVVMRAIKKLFALEETLLNHKGAA